MISDLAFVISTGKEFDPRAVFDFWSFTFIFHKISTLVEFPAPGQLSKVKSWLPGNFFELIPEGCPGDVPSWNWLGHKSTFLTVHVHSGKTINVVYSSDYCRPNFGVHQNSVVRKNLHARIKAKVFLSIHKKRFLEPIFLKDFHFLWSKILRNS